MKITFLGTGTSTGVPFIGCSCPVCQSPNPKDKRLRTSIWIHTENTNVVVDSGPDFRYQMLRAGVSRIDALVFTHGHKDHVAGLDDVRAFNFWQKESINLYANAQTEEVLRREFVYAFSENPYPGIPRLILNSIEGKERFQIKELTFQPVKVRHYQLGVYGYRVADFVYITDVNYIPPEEIKKIKGCKILVLSALRKEKHISHFTLSEAIEISKSIGAETTYITHISHQMGLADAVEATLPKGIHLAYDGLAVTV